MEEKSLQTLQKLIDAEKSDLFDALEYVSFAVKPITREARVASSQTAIFALLDNKQKEFLEFVLSKYIESCVGELDQEKLPILLQNMYQSLGDAIDIFGRYIKNQFPVYRISEVSVSGESCMTNKGHF